MKNSDLIKKLTSLIEALATAILMSEAKAGKIENAVARVNESFELNGEPKPLPTGEYKRRAWLLDDLRRMRLQLIEELRELYTEDEARAEADLFNLGIEGIRRVALYRDTVVNAEVAHAQAIAEDFTRLIEAQRAAGLPVDEEGNDLREWCGNDIEAAHAEALEEDRERAIDAYTEAPADADPTETIDRIGDLTARSVLRFARRWVAMQTASKEMDADQALRLLNDFMCYRLRGHDLLTADTFARAALYHEGLSVPAPVDEVAQ